MQSFAYLHSTIAVITITETRITINTPNTVPTAAPTTVPAVSSIGIPMDDSVVVCSVSNDIYNVNR